MISEKTEGNLQEELQRVLVDLETYKKQQEILEKQSQLLESTLIELESTQKALDNLNDSQTGKEILVPLGSGSFIRGELKDTQKILLGVGAGLSLEKTIVEAKKTFKERQESLTKSREELQKRAIDLNNKILELNPLAEKLLQTVKRV